MSSYKRYVIDVDPNSTRTLHIISSKIHFWKRTNLNCGVLVAKVMLSEDFVVKVVSLSIITVHVCFHQHH